MHSDIQVVKEALRQLVKADSWITSALELEEMDDDIRDSWEAIRSDVHRELRDFLSTDEDAE